MQRSYKIPVLAGVIVLICLGAGLWWMRAGGSSKTALRMAEIKRGDVAATISATGTIEPLEVVDVGAQVAGLINTFGTDVTGKTVDYGSVVEKDAVLATIDDSVYAANLGVARAQVDQDKAAELNAAANLEQSKAKLDQAAAEWKRAENLYASKLI